VIEQVLRKDFVLEPGSYEYRAPILDGSER
jgi:hypothetical protein